MSYGRDVCAKLPKRQRAGGGVFRFACFSLTSTPWCAAETMSRGKKSRALPFHPDVHDVHKPAAWWTPPSSCFAVEKAEFQSRWSSAASSGVSHCHARAPCNQPCLSRPLSAPCAAVFLDILFLIPLRLVACVAAERGSKQPGGRQVIAPDSLAAPLGGPSRRAR